jgi:hypothetical protein
MLPATISVAPNSPGERAKINKTPAKIPGQARGMDTRKNIAPSFSPRTRAAFSSCGSTVWKVVRADFRIKGKAAGLPQPASNRGYRPEQLMTQFMLSVWCGANRFEQGEPTRHNPVLKQVFGFERMANF